MTINQIKAMFVPGSVWSCRRQGEGFVINGNLEKTYVPASDVTEDRTVFSAKSELVWTRSQGNKIHTTWPKASQVQAAGAGASCAYLRFQYDNGVVCSFVRKS